MESFDRAASEEGGPAEALEEEEPLIAGDPTLLGFLRFRAMASDQPAAGSLPTAQVVNFMLDRDLFVCCLVKKSKI